MGIGIDELIALKVGINQAAEAYGFTPSTAALHVINVIKDYYKRGQLKHELYELNLQKYAISQFCSGHRDAMMALTNLPHMTHVGLDKHLKEQPSDKEITTYEQINANISNKMLENNEKITCGDDVKRQSTFSRCVTSVTCVTNNKYRTKGTRAAI
ncbi:MAG: hypothetical protein ACJ71I_14910 [Nitrososphaeraceae archaeon]